MENDLKQKLHDAAFRLIHSDRDYLLVDIQTINRAADEIDEYDELMLKVLADPQVKTLRDEWAITHFAALGMLAREENWAFEQQIHTAYQLADQAIAISKETGK